MKERPFIDGCVYDESGEIDPRVWEKINELVGASLPEPLQHVLMTNPWQREVMAKILAAPSLPWQIRHSHGVKSQWVDMSTERYLLKILEGKGEPNLCIAKPSGNIYIRTRAEARDWLNARHEERTVSNEGPYDGTMASESMVREDLEKVIEIPDDNPFKQALNKPEARLKRWTESRIDATRAIRQDTASRDLLRAKAQVLSCEKMLLLILVGETSERINMAQALMAEAIDEIAKAEDDIAAQKGESDD